MGQGNVREGQQGVGQKLASTTYRKKSDLHGQQEIGTTNFHGSKS